MTPLQELRARQRGDYRYFLDYRTRWYAVSAAGASATAEKQHASVFISDGMEVYASNDNDMYHHMNNSVYNFLIDSIVNDYLLKYCGLDPAKSEQHPLAAHLHTDFFASIAYPAVAELALRVNKLGSSSVTYEVGVFEKGVDNVKAVGEFVHVFVERATGRPAKTGMSDQLRDGLQKIYVGPESSKL